MSEQPAALRLAGQLDDPANAKIHLLPYVSSELRRLHEENQKLQQQLGEAVWNYGEKVRANQELLAALKELVAQHEASFFTAQVSGAAMTNARAAIAKGEQA